MTAVATRETSATVSKTTLALLGARFAKSWAASRSWRRSCAPDEGRMRRDQPVILGFAHVRGAVVAAKAFPFRRRSDAPPRGRPDAPVPPATAGYPPGAAAESARRLVAWLRARDVGGACTEAKPICGHAQAGFHAMGWTARWVRADDRCAGPRTYAKVPPLPASASPITGMIAAGRGYAIPLSKGGNARAGGCEPRRVHLPIRSRLGGGADRSRVLGGAVGGRSRSHSCSVLSIDVRSDSAWIPSSCSSSVTFLKLLLPSS